MRILIDIGHPGHVHFFKHAMVALKKRGHDLLICARNKDVTLQLLTQFGFSYRTLSEIGDGALGLPMEFFKREWRLIRTVKSFNPDIMAAIGGLFIAPVAKLFKKPSIVFTDTETVPLDKYLTYPFASLICTPRSFLHKLPGRHLRYNGYHELAYLHPNYFKPDPGIWNELGITENEPFIILRFVAWKASHDIGHHGFSVTLKKELIKRLGRFGRILISSESPLPKAFEQYRIQLPPHRIHHALYYASLFLGEGATMATEAAVLGTPSIYASPMALNLGNFIELMNKYKLVLSYQDPEGALDSAIRLLEENDIKKKWGQRRDQMLAESIDVTQFMVDLLEKEISTGA
jgi:predicted glycosyltransferase